MKIAYLVSKYPAPSHTFIRREIAALRRMGLHIDTCSIRPGESLSDSDRAEQAQTFYVLPANPLLLLWSQLVAFARRPRRWASTLVATLRHRLPGAGHWARALAYFTEAMRLAVELERKGIGHVHNHFSNPAASVGLAVSRYLGIGWSVTLHGFTDFAGPTAPLLPHKVEAARFVACVTQYGRAETMRLTRPDLWHKIHVIRCGIEVDQMPARRHSAPEPGRPIELLSVGRLSPEKGQLGLIDAFSQLAKRGIDARLVVVGGGPVEADLRASIAERGIGDRIALMGPLPEAAVIEAMAKADILVMSSLMEGLPVVLMEALAVELPVIAPKVGGIPELVVHRETGLLFAAGQWDQLAEAMAELAQDAGLRARLAAAGRARVFPEFDVARAVEPLAALFGRLGEGGRA